VRAAAILGRGRQIWIGVELLLGALAISTLGSLNSLPCFAQASPPAPAAPQDDKKTLKPEELDQILAPIALYPDSLLSQVLMATGYPLEIVEAARWSKANPALKGDAAVAAVKDKSWDVSVKSLVAFPAVLTQLSDHLEWTQKLGDRNDLAAAGRCGLDPATSRQGSGCRQSQERPAADRDEPGFGRGPHDRHRAGQPRGHLRAVLQPGLGLRRVALSRLSADLLSAAARLRLWSGPGDRPVVGCRHRRSRLDVSSWNWGRGNSYVNVNVNRAVNIDNHFDRNRYVNNNNRWQHDPGHRRGVAYRDPATRQQFGQHKPAGAAQRQEFRGQLAGRTPGHTPGQAPHLPQGGANRPHAGTHPQVQNRGNFAHGDRPSALSGVNRGQQVNREAMRGRAQQGRASSHPNFQRPSGGFHGGGGGGGFHGGGGARGGRR
jgi:uncharacterized membrane protein YgcG